MKPAHVAVKKNGLPRLKFMSDVFRCKARRRWINLEKCLDDYCNANAFGKRTSACFGCAQGKKNRHNYSAELL
jgi:hypothetical protein